MVADANICLKPGNDNALLKHKLFLENLLLLCICIHFVPVGIPLMSVFSSACMNKMKQDY